MDIKPMRKVVLNRKIKYCEDILLKYGNIKPSEIPTRTIFVGNGGLGYDIQTEFLRDIFQTYGPVMNVIMFPDKPYAFVLYKNIEDAEIGMKAVNGQKLESGHVFYLSYINDSDLPPDNFSRNLWPNGLICIEDFITEDEEKEFLSAVRFEDSENTSTLKHREVKHYGYDAKIPEIFYPHLEKLVSLGYISRIPDQLTVNHYLPGQGIPSHIDTHSAFEDGIIFISLGSQVIMDFVHPIRKSVPVVVPRRSALIMTGESRYFWKHGITPHKTDVIPIKNGETSNLTLCYRYPRTSLTFRLIRPGECQCDYVEQCDSQIKSKSLSNDFVNEDEAEELEHKFVNQVYENIADLFRNIRLKPWPKVSSFLCTVPPGSIILDIGCGNGKHMGLSSSCYEIGCDASSKLVEVCSSQKVEVLVADCLKLPFRSNWADVVICIAVIHHLSTKIRRAKAIAEIIRILCDGGKAHIQVWALEQDVPEGPYNYLKPSKLVPYREGREQNVPEGPSNYLKPSKLVPDREGSESVVNIESAEIELRACSSTPKTIQMPVYKNRTDFIQQDLLVPWQGEKLPCQTNKPDSENAVLRFYHVFTKGELEALVTENNGHILSSYYDEGDWCVLFEK